MEILFKFIVSIQFVTFQASFNIDIICFITVLNIYIYMNIYRHTHMFLYRGKCCELNMSM